MLEREIERAKNRRKTLKKEKEKRKMRNSEIATTNVFFLFLFLSFYIENVLFC